jgi:hypothetical protein
MATELPARYKSSPENIVEARNAYFANSENPLLRRHFYSTLNPRQALVDASTMPESQRTLMGMGEEANASAQETLLEQQQGKPKPKSKKKVPEEDTLRVSEDDEIAFKQTDTYKEWLNRFNEELTKGRPSPVKTKELYDEYGKLFEGFVREQRAGASVQEALTEQKQNKPKPKGKKKAKGEDTLRVSEADEIAFKQTDIYREWLNRFQAEMSKSKPSPVKLKGFWGEYGRLFENFVRGRRTGASVQETLLNQKAEVPTKKNETPTSTNFWQNTVDSAQNNATDPQTEADNVSVEESAEQTYDAFLKGNGQSLGIASYGACVDLLITYYYPKLFI